MLPPRNRSWVNTEPLERRQRWLVTILLALSALFDARTSWAQRVVLVRPVQSDPVLGDAFNRIQAELRLQLFEVVVIEARGTDPIQSTADAANEQNALAAVSLRKQTGGATAELCIVDRATGKTSLRRLTLEHVADAPAVLAIRAVDLLRASLREFDGPKAAAPEIRDVARVADSDVAHVRAWVHSSEPRTSARLGFAWLDVASRVTGAYGIDLRLDYAVVAGVRFGVGLMGPMIGAHFDSPLGRATIRQQSVVLRSAIRLLRARPFELWPNLGLGIYHLDADSEAIAPLVSKRAQIFALLGTAGLAGAIWLLEPIALELEASAVLLTPRPGVAVAEYAVLYRRPLITATLGVRAQF